MFRTKWPARAAVGLAMCLLACSGESPTRTDSVAEPSGKRTSVAVAGLCELPPCRPGFAPPPIGLRPIPPIELGVDGLFAVSLDRYVSSATPLNELVFEAELNSSAFAVEIDPISRAMRIFGTPTAETAVLTLTVTDVMGRSAQRRAQVAHALGHTALRLRDAATQASSATAQVGDTIDVEIVVELGTVTAAGAAFYLSVPEGIGFVDELEFIGVQPFAEGPFLDGAVQVSNIVLPEEDPVAAALEGQQLEYAAVLGASGDRSRSGTGVVATLRMVCLAPFEGDIVIDDNPVRETLFVHPDGITESRFATLEGLQLSVVAAN